MLGAGVYLGCGTTLVLDNEQSLCLVINMDRGQRNFLFFMVVYQYGWISSE